jgi:TRAP-type mannitol/chloroaromatic compound transport system permease small subunit
MIAALFSCGHEGFPPNAELHRCPGFLMKRALCFSAGIDRITAIVAHMVSWLVLATVLVSVANAFIRYIGVIHIGSLTLTSSNTWLEMQWYLFSAVFLLASAYTLQRNEHVRVDVIFVALPRRVQHWINLLGHMFMLLPFSALMIFFAVPFMMTAYQQDEVSGNGGLLIWPVKALVVMGFSLLFLQCLSEIIKQIAIMRGIIPDPYEAKSRPVAETSLQEPQP